MKIIAITNQKGGVGKTTTAVNLSAALARMGQTVVLADTDPQGNATSVLRAENTGPSFYEVMLGQSHVSDIIQPTRLDNLFLIPANLDMSGAEIEVARMDEHLLQLRNALSPVKNSREIQYMILDCPPSLGIWMSNALAAADEVIIPIQCEYYALEGLSLLMQVLDQIRISGANPDLSISGMVMTMFDNRNNLNPAVVEEVRNHFGEVLFETVIPRSVRLAEAPSHGRTIFEHDPNGPGSAAYRKLAEEFLQRQMAGIAFLAPSTTNPAQEAIPS